SCYDANEAARAAEIADRLRAGARVALVSEAGTPLVSDPGYRVVAAAIAAGARIVPVPGPSAALAALVASGLPPDRFLVLGFAARYAEARPLGEVTLVVGGAPSDAEADVWDDEAIAERAAELVAGGASPRDAAHELAAQSGRPRRDVYRIVVQATGAGEAD